MSYTNADVLRQHLSSPYPTLDRVYDHPVLLRNLDPVQFFGGAIDSDSFVVKNLQKNQLSRTTKTCTAGAMAIGATRLVRGSVLVATDSSLGQVFTENLDYTVDYDSGVIACKTDSLLNDGTTYIIWYAAYHQYQLDVDYELSADEGKLNRINAGEIASGESVLVDFTPIFASFGDDTLQFAAVEANALVEMEVDPNQQYGGNPILQSAATCLGLAEVCRTAASRELSRLRGESQTAAGWMKLAESYSERGEQLLKSFRPPLIGPSAPTHD